MFRFYTIAIIMPCVLEVQKEKYITYVDYIYVIFISETYSTMMAALYSRNL